MLVTSTGFRKKSLVTRECWFLPTVEIVRVVESKVIPETLNRYAFVINNAEIALIKPVDVCYKTLKTINTYSE
jgi:hypothetical protein